MQPDSSATEGQKPSRGMSPLKEALRSTLRGFRLFKLKLKLRGRLKMGKNVAFGAGVDLRPAEFIEIGDNVWVAKHLTVESNLIIGNDVLISSRVSFVGNDHRFDDPNLTVFWGGRLPPTTVIVEGDNLIGYGVTVVGNVRIGKGSIIGAGAVVTRDMPPGMICVGVPAKPIKPRWPQATPQNG